MQDVPLNKRKIRSRLLQAWWKDPKQFSRKKLPRTCPVCGYEGIFLSVGRPSRWDVRCPNCASRPRHRLMQLYLDKHNIDLTKMSILQFGPEKWLMTAMRNNPAYEPADLYAKIARFRLDITEIDRPDNHFDAIVAHHVLEHIDDDRKAMAELARVLKPGGIGFLSVPLNMTRDTYENPAITEPWERFWHFGGTDHKRYYGMDLANRLEESGFKVETFRTDQETEIKHALDPCDVLFVVTK